MLNGRESLKKSHHDPYRFCMNTIIQSVVIRLKPNWSQNTILPFDVLHV